MSELKSISPAKAADLVKRGARLVDIREIGEYAREHIPGAHHHALSRIDTARPSYNSNDVLIFHCRSGARTRGNASRLLTFAKECDAYVLEGGIDSWKKAGLPVKVDRSQPIDVMRQMQIGAGGLVLVGVLLGHFVAPPFYVLSGFVGAGLLLAGTTGFCPMVRLLNLMPWNRRVQALRAG